jgi:lambda family phage portal protein
VSRRDVQKAVRDAAQGNVLERVIGTVAPVWAARRQKARMFMAIAGGYTGASHSRRQTSAWKHTKGQSADADILPDAPDLRDRSRDLVRNEPLAAGAIAGTVTSVVGTGLALQSRVGHKVLGITEEQAAELQRLIESEYNLWAESTACDATRTHDMYGLQALVFRGALESGDAFALTPMRALRLMPYKTCLQILEADQCSNPSSRADTNQLAGGVELDQWRAPVAYHFRKDHPGALNRSSAEWVRMAAFGERTGRRQVIHLYDKLRPGQTRGAPWLAPVIETLKMLGKYTEAELMAAVVSGMFTVFVESERGGIDPVDGSGLAGETGAHASDKDVKLASGAIIDLNPGEKVQFANPGRPNQAFDGFVLSLCRFVGIALELPYEVLIKHFTASYSASRGALLEAWKFYRKRRVWLASGFCNPVFEIWMDEAVSSGRIAAPGYFDDPLRRRAYLGAEWVGDGPISVDPVKDVEAAKGRLELGISNRRKEAALYDGSDWEQNHEQLVKEHQVRVRDGLHQPAPSQAAPAQPRSTGNNAGSDDERGGDQEDKKKEKSA